jgi:hypothetical protein
MMKIAYLNIAPEQKEWDGFINEYTGKMHKLDNWALDGGINSSPCYTIAAYDDTKLVAIGYLPADANQPQLESTMIHVLPDYSHRGLGITIQKLLLAEWKFNPQPVAL